MPELRGRESMPKILLPDVPGQTNMLAALAGRSKERSEHGRETIRLLTLLLDEMKAIHEHLERIPV